MRVQFHPITRMVSLSYNKRNSSPRDFKRCVYWLLSFRSFPWVLDLHDIDSKQQIILLTLPPISKTNGLPKSKPYQIHNILKELEQNGVVLHPKRRRESELSVRDNECSITDSMFFQYSNRVYLVDFSGFVTCRNDTPIYTQISSSVLESNHEVQCIPNQHENKKVAIFLHVGSVDTFNILLSSYITLVCRVLPHVVVICTYLDTLPKVEQTTIIQTLSDVVPKSQFHPLLVENRGMDIGAFFQTMWYCQKHQLQFDVVLKLHTKSDKTWRSQLCEPIIGSDKSICKSLHMFAIPEIGCVASKQWAIPIETDTHNMNLLTYYCAQLQFQDVYGRKKQTKTKTKARAKTKTKTKTQRPLFIGGTIFWFRFSIFEKLFHTHSRILRDSYNKMKFGYITNSQETHTHTWERLLGLLVTEASAEFELF